MINIHLNPRVRNVGVSPTVAINDLSNELLSDGRNVFKLGLGESPFPVPDSVVEALRAAAEEKSYLPVKGLPELREAIADHHRREFDVECDPEDVLIGPGSKELMFLLQLAYYGDLIIPSPSWVSYAPQAGLVGRKIHWVETSSENNWLITAEELEAVCSRNPTEPRLMIMNYPSNPTGHTYTHDQLKDLAEVARRHNIVLLSDEIYGKLHHDGAHESIARLYPEGTIFSGGLSKWCGAGGWRLGVFVFPPGLRWLLDAMAAVGSETFTSTCNPVQRAATCAFRENPEIDNYLRDARRILKALGSEMAGRLKSVGSRIESPEGGFYLFPDFSPFREKFHQRGIETSNQFWEHLLEDTGVAILPGSVFGRPENEFTARLAYVDFDGRAALKAASRIPPTEPLGDAFLEEHCGRMLDAVDLISGWVGSNHAVRDRVAVRIC